MQTTRIRNAFFQTNISAPAGHIRGDCHTSGPPGFGNDGGFFAILPRIEHAMRQSLLREQPAKMIGRRHSARSHQHRSAALPGIGNRPDDAAISRRP